MYLLTACGAFQQEDAKSDAERIFLSLEAAAAPLRACVRERVPERDLSTVAPALVQAGLADQLEARALRLLGKDVAEGVDEASQRATKMLRALHQHNVPLPDPEQERELHFGARTHMLRRKIEADLFVAQLPNVQCQVTAELRHWLSESDGYEMVIEIGSALQPLLDCLGPFGFDVSQAQVDRFDQTGRLAELRDIARRYLPEGDAGATESESSEDVRLLQRLSSYAVDEPASEPYPLRVKRMMAFAELTYLHAPASRAQCQIPENLTNWMEVASHEYL